MDIRFLGATGTVTGSKYLVSAGGKQILIDCGLFQGLKQLRLKNWARLPVDPREIDAVILTHAAYRPHRLSAAARQKRLSRKGLLQRRHPRPVRSAIARFRPSAGGGGEIREPAGIFQTSSGATALHARRRRAGAARPAGGRIRTPSSISAAEIPSCCRHPAISSARRSFRCARTAA